MTPPAPDTGRTAEENELREALETELALVIHGGGMISPRAFASLLIAGPLAKLIAQRDEVRGYANRNGNAARYWEWIHDEKDKRLARAEAEAAHLRAENANLRDRVREAEGAAEALPDMLRKCRFQSAVIDTLSEEIGNARRMTNGWAKGTLLLLPFVDMAAGEGLEWAEQDDGSPRMDAADLCAAFAKAMGLEIGDAAYMAMIAEGRDAIRALSPEHQEAGDHEPR